MAKSKKQNNKKTNQVLKDVIVFLLIGLIILASWFVVQYLKERQEQKNADAQNQQTELITVTFDGAGGILTSGELVQNVSKASDIKAPTFTRSGYKFVGFDKDLKTITKSTTVTAVWQVVNNIVNESLEIHFLASNGKYSGDCIYIKAGEADILIDAGSRQSSAKEITEYLDHYVVDGSLEYVIATHADQDHIAGFVGTTKIPGVFDYYECLTIIDFPLTNKSDGALYQKYIDKRNQEVENGAKRYSALECYNNQNGASRTYELADGIELEILYNYFYENKSADENNYSVCCMINYGDKHYLFTGDLETKGEEYLVQYNTLPEVELFKAGHHGSPTSSTDTLLSVIKPKSCVVCCCAGSDEYTDNKDNQFPSQAFISRIKNYTEEIYVTTIVSNNEAGFEEMNGNIVFTINQNNVTVSCSNNDTYLKDTDWFKENRKWE